MMQKLGQSINILFIICLVMCEPFTLGKALAFGNISNTYKYAWSENSNWENFHPTHGGVTVHDTYLSGYAWAENIGWVKLGSGSGPYANTTSTNWGVNRDSATGNLSGYAWSENVRWINFKPSYGGVTVNKSTGKFDGYAWGENIGWVHFKNASPEYYVMQETDSPAIIYVNKDDSTCDGNDPCYGSIQDAVSVGGTGATIRVGQGTYDESIVLNVSKSLTLAGGWDVSFTGQTANKTFIKAPSVPQGSLTFQMLTIKDLTAE